MNHTLINKLVEGHVLVLQMNDGASRNALSYDLLSGLSKAILDLDTKILGVVLTGDATCFSAGGDFRELNGTTDDLAYDEAVARLIASIQATDKVIVAAIEGPCMGAAADIALACDYRVAGEGSHMQIPAVRLGLLYNPEAVVRLVRRYPSDTVRRLLLAGESFVDHEARAAGLFSRIVPAGQALDSAVQGLLKMDPQQSHAASLTKQLLTALDTAGIDMDYWKKQRFELLGSEQRRTAIRHMRERFLNKPDTH